jgi:hypothetical protein
MNKRKQLMASGAIVFVIGIAITLFGYNKYKSVETVLTELATEAPPGAIEATIGLLILVVGMFIAIYGFGQMKEEVRIQ